jgi:hypothetical protein
LVFAGILLAPVLVNSLSKSVIAADLNQLFDRQAVDARERILNCLKEAEKLNFSGGVSVRNGVVYKGIPCGGLYGGYSGWTIIGRLGEVESFNCDRGTYQEQWVIRDVSNGPGRNPRHLVKLRKENNCEFSARFTSAPSNELSISEIYYPVRWTCVRHSGYDPERIGLDCTDREID